jgi:hypothetical protein
MVAGVFMCTMAQPLGAQWSVTEFEVMGYGPSKFALSLAEPHLVLGDMIQTAGDTAEIRLRRDIEAYLHEAAVRLAAWGFPEPALNPPGQTLTGRYRVYLVDQLEDAAGRTHGDHCFGPGITRRAILIDRSDVTRTDPAGSELLTAFGYEALGHELFHAVQHAMRFFEAKCALKWELPHRVGDWITEGTAEAVGVDLARMIRPGPTPTWGNREYDRPLPVPLRLNLLSETASADAVNPYETASFWRYLAEMHARKGALPGIGPDEPIDYGYLVRMFGDQATRDCNAVGAACAAELKWLDGWMIRQFGRNLKQSFPLFIETLAMYGERGGRARTSMSSIHDASNWRVQVFKTPCTEVKFERGGSRSVRTLVGQFHPNSARCWQVSADTLAADAALGITVIGPRGAPSLAHLSVATGGPPVETDSPTVVFTQERTQADWVVLLSGGSSTPRQAGGRVRPGGDLRVGVPAGDTILAFMTNVAPDPAESGLMTDLPVVFTLIEPFATIVSISTSPGPSGADVDQPIGVRFERLGQSILTDRVAGFLAGYRLDGMTEPCILRVMGLSNAQGDALTFGMDHDGPIRPGTYAIADSRRTKYGTPWPRGMVVAGFGFGAANPLSGGGLQSFNATNGSLRIQSVSGGFVRGVVEINGENRLAERIARGDEPPNPYVPNATIRVEFGVRLRDPGDPVEQSAVAACLKVNDQ